MEPMTKEQLAARLRRLYRHTKDTILMEDSLARLGDDMGLTMKEQGDAFVLAALLKSTNQELQFFIRDVARAHEIELTESSE